MTIEPLAGPSPDPSSDPVSDHGPPADPSAGPSDHRPAAAGSTPPFPGGPPVGATRSSSAEGADHLEGVLAAEEIIDADREGDRPFAPGTARAALSYSAFRRIYTGWLASNIGTWMQNVVLTQWAFFLTKSPTFVSIVIFA